MTKQYFIQLAEYNVWANHRVAKWCDSISNDQWLQPIVSSFDGIGATALHILSAEHVWLDRLHKVPAPVWLQQSFKGSKEETLKLWLDTSKGILRFLEEFDEREMQDAVAFKRLNGDAYEMPHYQVFAHIFNHSTYHRGQIVTLMRQAGNIHLDSTDLLAFYRK
jgi:uncharacterized damage-inducible protein DinB